MESLYQDKIDKISFNKSPFFIKIKHKLFWYYNIDFH